MNKRLERIKMGVSVFYYSAKKQMFSEDTILISAGVGLYQGLKYRGSLKQGIKAGLATMITVGAVNGFLNVVEHKDKIKEV